MQLVKSTLYGLNDYFDDGRAHPEVSRPTPPVSIKAILRSGHGNPKRILAVVDTIGAVLSAQ